MGVTYEQNGDCGIVHVEGPLMVSDTEQFRQSFGNWFATAKCQRVVVDMAKVDFLDSAGLGALVAAARLVRDKGGDLCFAALQKRARMVFEITRSYTVFDLYATLDEALRATP